MTFITDLEKCTNAHNSSIALSSAYGLTLILGMFSQLFILKSNGLAAMALACIAFVSYTRVVPKAKDRFDSYLNAKLNVATDYSFKSALRYDFVSQCTCVVFMLLLLCLGLWHMWVHIKVGVGNPSLPFTDKLSIPVRVFSFIAISLISFGIVTRWFDHSNFLKSKFKNFMRVVR